MTGPLRICSSLRLECSDPRMGQEMPPANQLAVTGMQMPKKLANCAISTLDDWPAGKSPSAFQHGNQGQRGSRHCGGNRYRPKQPGGKLARQLRA